MGMNKNTFENKLFLINEITQENKPIKLVAKENGINYTTLSEWLRKYHIHGEDALRPWCKRYHYTDETKIAAVKEVVYGKSSMSSVIKKYNISSPNVLNGWISKYNKGENLRKRKGRSLMTKRNPSRQTTFKERIEIVQYALAYSTDYLAAAEEYKVSYQQVYNWVEKYKSSGINGLQDKRGQEQSTEGLSELDQLRIENKKLRDRNQLLEMEQDFTKKLQELRQRYKTSL